MQSQSPSKLTGTEMISFYIESDDRSGQNMELNQISLKPAAVVVIAAQVDYGGDKFFSQLSKL